MPLPAHPSTRSTKPPGTHTAYPADPTAKARRQHARPGPSYSETTSLERAHDQTQSSPEATRQRHRRGVRLTPYTVSRAKKLSHDGAHFLRLLLDAAESERAGLV